MKKYDYCLDGLLNVLAAAIELAIRDWQRGNRHFKNGKELPQCIYKDYTESDYFLFNKNGLEDLLNRCELNISMNYVRKIIKKEDLYLKIKMESIKKLMKAKINN